MRNILYFYFKQLLTVVNFSKGAICGFFNDSLNILKMKNKFKEYSNPIHYKEYEEKTTTNFTERQHMLNTATISEKKPENIGQKNKLEQQDTLQGFW